MLSSLCISTRARLVQVTVTVAAVKLAKRFPLESCAKGGYGGLPGREDVYESVIVSPALTMPESASRISVEVSVTPTTANELALPNVRTRLIAKADGAETSDKSSAAPPTVIVSVGFVPGATLIEEMHGIGVSDCTRIA